MSQDRVAVVIPSRYASTRFPAKPLAMLCGKPMVQHVYEKAAASSADLTVVATDHQAIYNTVVGFGGKAVMTAESHPSGTDRIAEAVSKLGGEVDIIINVQGDEPLIPTSVIDELIAIMKCDPSIEMATVAVPGNRATMTENNVKVVFGEDRFALYFSRSMIPFLRKGGVEAPVYLHWGIYAYRRSALERFVSLPPGRLENCEKLEQLRALENGIRIYVHLSELESIGIDTPEDLVRAEKKLLEGR
ncbi:3-deoxy-manno-octulosonate cytidylyltransferase [uncultured Victivallis sp.]|uniref:3-deoxy-manno-octulosonate cytidylyltransferase n=1 Tax=uncultured Victivallis sp. TaxID=354118 RepID=UPI0025D1DF40|nr:3-deoxy-manno-octulosonate cytidylyltransferase [uncultured Victivallis sp.]